jgi:D-sedoheptulose 7-phosphate isomerase
MDERIERIGRAIAETVRVKQGFGEDLKRRILDAADAIFEAHRKGGRTLTMGNGGSAADAQHLAAELVGRFLKERRPMDVLALTTNSSTLTCLINDYPPEEVFERQVRAHARKGDVVFGISTSGNSPNILRALEAARSLGATTIGLTGETGGAMKDRCDILLNVPSKFTPRIQEAHIFVIHLICEFVEEKVAAASE